MPHDKWRNPAPRAAVITVDIASAYAARFDLYQYIARTEFGFWDISHLKISSVFEYKSLHVSKDNL